jgi:hypothetical protein
MNQDKKLILPEILKLFRLLNDICLIADHPGWLVWDHLNFGKALVEKKLVMSDKIKLPIMLNSTGRRKLAKTGGCIVNS